MDERRIEIERYSAPLAEPYRLPFATLTGFDGFFVHIVGEGRRGVGEITPLPGYTGETMSSVADLLRRAVEAFEAGGDPDATITALSRTAPMTASGLATAFETWRDGSESAFATPLSGPVPLAAICQGDTPESLAGSARRAAMSGYRDIKIKLVAGDPAAERKRIAAAAAVLGPDGAIRIDANQSLAPAAAHALCAAIGDLPVVWLEQPFAADDWDAVERLARASDVPIMLDESVLDDDDVRRAADVGAKAVKLKLCKHAGIAATRRMAATARRHGLVTVIGNGVQSAVGNHLEAGLHLELGLDRAAECNGFLKTTPAGLVARMSVRRGELIDDGIALPDPARATWLSGRIAARSEGQRVHPGF